MMSPEQELSMLRDQAEALRGQLEQIANRIEELEKK
jgi:prefoldin subunit 5